VANDTYIVDNSGDVVMENAGEGTDTVQSSLSYTLGANFENLTLTGTADINGTGNSLSNVITGNNGNNILDAGTGTDTLIGGAGNDTYILHDTSFAKVYESAGEGIDTVQAWQSSYTLGANLENLILSSADRVYGRGNELDNVLEAYWSGSTLVGGLGNDTYIVGGYQVVVESPGEGIDTVKASHDYVLGANVENLILGGECKGTGNELDNVITDSTGHHNVLDGGAGADTLIGGKGHDTYVVDNVGDVVIENAGEGLVDSVQSSITYILGANLEDLTLTGTTNINGRGNELANVITGNDGDNILDGWTGDDILRGGQGNDTYVFSTGYGNDTIQNNESTGWNGFDTLQFYDLTMAMVEFSTSGNDLVCTITGNGGTIRITDWTLGVSYEVETFQFSDGSLDAAQVKQIIG
jgi:trimeric autotransporter adhesin